MKPRVAQLHQSGATDGQAPVWDNATGIYLPKTVLLDVTTTKGDLLARTSSAIARLGVGSDGQVLTADSASTPGVKWATPTSAPTNYQRQAFAYNGTIAVATGKSRFYFDQAVTIDSVVIGIDTAPTGASVIVDVNKNGVTIFTTQANRPTIAISGNTSGAVTSMDITAFASGDYLTIDIDQIGSTIAGADLTAVVRYH